MTKHRWPPTGRTHGHHRADFVTATGNFLMSLDNRWTWLIAAAYTQLRLDRGHVADLRLPWDKRRDPTNLTPARVRRGFRRLCKLLGTPANPPKSDKAGPGRPKGTRRPPRTRYPAIKKAT